MGLVSKMHITFANLKVVTVPTATETKGGLLVGFAVRDSVSGCLMSLQAWGEIAESAKTLQKNDVIDGRLEAVPYKKQNSTGESVKFKVLALYKHDDFGQKTIMTASIVNMVPKVYATQKRTASNGIEYANIPISYIGSDLSFVMRGKNQNSNNRADQFSKWRMKVNEDTFCGFGTFCLFESQKKEIFRYIDVDYVTFGKRVSESSSSVEENVAANDIFKEGIDCGKSFG